MRVHSQSIRGKRFGFTLVETVIAMGIITIMITAFLAAFGPAVQGIRKSISAKEANRLASTLETELSILRSTEHVDNGGDYTTAFEKAFEWIKGSGTNTKDNFVLIYQYRGDPNDVRGDGTLNPYTGTDGIPGEDYVLQSVVRRLGDAETQDELVPTVVEGRVFYVRMKQLIFNNGALELTGDANVGKIVDPKGAHSEAANHTQYPEAVIAFQAEFYVLKSSLYSYINGPFNATDTNGDGHPDATGKPVFTRNLGVRR
ncbi:MAG: type II secretion system protein [Akkermansiaceae bacterium]